MGDTGYVKLSPVKSESSGVVLQIWSNILLATRIIAETEKKIWASKIILPLIKCDYRWTFTANTLYSITGSDVDMHMHSIMSIVRFIFHVFPFAFRSIFAVSYITHAWNIPSCLNIIFKLYLDMMEYFKTFCFRARRS